MLLALQHQELDDYHVAKLEESKRLTDGEKEAVTPMGKQPNVLPAPVEWDASVPASLVTLLPNVSYLHSSAKQRALLEGSSGASERIGKSRDLADWFRASLADGLRPPEPEGGRVLKGLALVAAHPLKDQELFMNYRLNPANHRKNGFPDWYSPVDLEEDLRRWS